jgi:Putative zinc-finger
MSCQHSVSLGVYVLGSLEPGERSAMERHLAGCPFCQRELVRFSPLPGLLGRICLADIEDLDNVDFDPTALVPPVPEQPRPPRTRPAPARPEPPVSQAGPSPKRRRGKGRWTFLATAAVIVAALAVSAVLVRRSLAGQPTAEAPTAEWKSTDSTTNVSATADLTTKAWGTQVMLNVSNLPAGQVCQLLVHNKNGQTQSVGWWRNGEETGGQVPAATSYAVGDIDRMDVVTIDNKQLVDLAPR